jgi:hypothetical protein
MSLAREAVGTSLRVTASLKANGAVHSDVLVSSAGQVQAQKGASNFIAMGEVFGNGANKPGIDFGDAQTVLYRDAENTLRTENEFVIASGGPAAAQTALLIMPNGIGIRRVEVGAPNSDGAGFRSLRVAN